MIRLYVIEDVDFMTMIWSVFGQLRSDCFCFGRGMADLSKQLGYAPRRAHYLGNVHDLYLRAGRSCLHKIDLKQFRCSDVDSSGKDE